MRTLWLVIALGFVTLLSGCATALVPERIKLESEARYGELVHLQETDIARIKEPSSSDLYNLCYAYSKVKDYTKLFSCTDKLERKIKSGDTKVNLYTSIFKSDGSPTPYLLRAEAYIELTQYRSAIVQATEGYRLSQQVDSTFFGIEHPQQMINSLGLLALAYTLSGDETNAKLYLGILEDLSLPFGGEAQTDPMKKHAIALVYMANGSFGKALEILNDSDGGFSRAFGSGLLGGGENLFATLELPNKYMKSKCLLETGKITQAKEGYEELLRNAYTQNVGEIYWLALFDRGRIAEAEKDLETATSSFQKAIEVIESQRSTINTEASKIGFVGDKQAVYGQLIAVLVAQGRVADAFDYIERSKSRALVDMLAGKQDFTAHETDPQKSRQILAQLDAADLASRTLYEPAQSGEGASVRSGRNLTLVRQQVQAAAPELATLVTVSAVPSADLKSLIGPDEALVEYYYQGKDLYAFVLTKERLQAVKLNEEGLDTRVRDLRETLAQVTSEDWKIPAEKLYRQIWQPLEGMLGSTKRVVVVPHGVLHYLPFAALCSPDGKFLIDQYGMRFLPSASVLKFLRPAQHNKNAEMLVLGNPDLGDPKLDLQFAESEARTVAALFPSSKLLVRKDASETNFKKVAGVFSRIHFATHGKFEADNALASGLYLAKDDKNDGELTVGELYSMNLDTDLGKHRISLPALMIATYE